MTEETAGTPTLAAQAKRRIRTCMRLFHNAEDNWGVEMASEHMDNINPEHTLLDWIDDGIDALEREVAALTTQRDRVVNSHKVLMAEADKRLETAEAELDAAKRALAEANRLIKNLAPTGRYEGLDIEGWYQRAMTVQTLTQEQLVAGGNVLWEKQFENSAWKGKVKLIDPSSMGEYQEVAANVYRTMAALAAKSAEQKEEGLDLLGQPLHQSNGES